MLRFLVVIVTWFLSTGGLPHQSADWFAMTANLKAKPFKHQFIEQLRCTDMRINSLGRSRRFRGAAPGK